MKIEIPEGFLPPPGVPLATHEQLALATALARMRMIDLQVQMPDGSFSKWQGAGNGKPECYRLAAPKPRTVGPFESRHLRDQLTGNAYQAAVDSAISAGFENYRIHLTATAEEIL